jgi:hypothetical protein
VKLRINIRYSGLGTVSRGTVVSVSERVHTVKLPNKKEKSATLTSVSAIFNEWKYGLRGSGLKEGEKDGDKV